ncbi:MarR family transcriptional regulator [Sphingomonas koreensis]|nr:MarR family transcriptional regulator [Sphingomonas koreensis]
MADLATLSLMWCQSDRYVEMTARQIALLGILCDAPGPHRVRDLAKLLRVSKPVITRAVNRLGEHRAAVRLRDPNDKRDLEVRATDRGRELRAALRGDA